MKNIVVRSISGFIYIAILIAGVSIHQYGFLALFTVITIFALREFYMLLKNGDRQPQLILGIFLGVLLFLSVFCSFAHAASNKGVLFSVSLISVLFIYELFRGKENPFSNIACTLLGLVYIALPISFLNGIVFIPIDGVLTFVPYILLGVLFLIWTFDTAAFLTGISIGKHRLYEKISPKKSWEGAIGGLVAAIGAAVVISKFFDVLDVTQWITLSIIVSVFGTVGDLVESQFKRSLGVKDSGSFIPGHGGLLDRFDSLIFVSPFVFIYLQLVIF